jgi:hypothetical protein
VVFIFASYSVGRSTTSALFFEPKPMQLQSATLTSRSRARLGV